ncbi:amidohydrolase [Agrobacterium sp. rho-8.1]|nr:amidohydrolase [Agrobacterium sp. rho-8.1]
MKLLRFTTLPSARALAFTALCVFSAAGIASAQGPLAGTQTQENAQWKPTPWLDVADDAVTEEVVSFRHHIHQNPELGNQEIKTAAFVAEHLKKLGLEVHTGIAGPGVVAVLTGKLPGPIVGLRADMDALPVKETSGLPFASQAKGIYFSKQVDVMHACGHDAHTAMLMSAATVMASNIDKIPGKVVFIFQPAEEGAADIDVFAGKTETWGARRMVEEGVIERFGIEAVFGVHVMSNLHSGHIEYKSGAALNSADGFKITLTGKQAHGSMPWTGADPIVAGADVIMGMQTIVSRQANLSQGMGVISVGSIHAGTAGNIIPGELTMQGTIRSNNPGIRDTMLAALPVMVENTAHSHHVEADVSPISCQ